jgi:hypothetical protein
MKGKVVMVKDRKAVLLKACLDLLKKQDESSYVLDLRQETVFYDGTDCDGYCLMEDIECELMDERLRLGGE